MTANGTHRSSSQAGLQSFMPLRAFSPPRRPVPHPVRAFVGVGRPAERPDDEDRTVQGVIFPHSMRSSALHAK